MAIVYGAPSRFIELGRDGQNIAMRESEMAQRQAMFEQEQFNQAMANLGGGIGRGGMAAIEARLQDQRERERFDRGEQAYRDRLAYAAGFPDATSAEKYAADSGVTLPELYASRKASADFIGNEEQTRAALDRQQRLQQQRLPQIVAEHALEQAMQPLTIPPELQQLVPNLPPQMKQTLAEIMANDHGFLMDMYSNDPELHPEEVIEGRRRLQGQLAPIIGALRQQQAQQVPVADQINKKLNAPPPAGVIMAMDKNGVPTVVYEPPDPAKHSSFDTMMSQGYADWVNQGNDPRGWLAPGGGADYAREAWLKSREIRDQKTNDVIGYIDDQGKPQWRKETPDHLRTKAIDLATKLATTPMVSGTDENPTTEFMDAAEAGRRAATIVKSIEAALSGEAPPANQGSPVSTQTQPAATMTKPQALARRAQIMQAVRSRGGLNPGNPQDMAMKQELEKIRDLLLREATEGQPPQESFKPMGGFD